MLIANYGGAAMNIHIKELSEMTGICVSCIRNYIARAEFSHIIKCRGIIYRLREKDVKRLRELFDNRRKRRKCYSNTAENAKN